MNPAFRVRSFAALGLLGLSLVLFGCATPYGQDHGYGGYSDTSIEKNLYRVAFSSPGGLSAGGVHDLALLRAAEVARDHGYAWFSIVKENSGVTTRLETLPDAGIYTDYSRPVWVPTPNGPRLVIVSDPYWDEPRLYPAPIPFTELYIRGYATKAAAGARAYEADEVIPRLRAEYKITK